jgi:Protein of unknown function (DUF4236)
MSFRFRRTMGIAPGIRLNLSRSGPSISFGPRGLHYTIGMKGNRTTVGIPGTGLFWTSYQRHGSNGATTGAPDLLPPPTTETVPAGVPTRLFESADIAQLVAASTSELAPHLDAARKKFPIHLIVLAFAGGLLAGAIGYDQNALAGAALVIGLVGWPIVFAIDRKRRTTTLEYNLAAEQNERFGNLVSAFSQLRNCNRIWRVPIEWDQRDWKRNAGSGVTVQRQAIGLRMGLPSLVKSNLQFPSLPLGKETLYLAPDSILIVSRNSVAALHYDDCDIVASTTRFIESGGAPTDAQVVGQTWQYVNKNGGPDRRFSNNRQLPICMYGQIDLKSSSGLNERFHCSNSNAAASFAAGVVAMREIGMHQASVERPLANQPPNHEAVGETQSIEAEFANETERARTLALKHGQFWEYLLIQELMKSRLVALKNECDELGKARSSVPTIHYDAVTFISWVIEQSKIMSSAISVIARCVNQDLLIALGKPGEPGNPILMLRTINTLFGACGSFGAFERDLCAADPPKEMVVLKESLEGITASIAGTLERFSEQWNEAVDGLLKGSHEFNVKLVFTAPPQIGQFVAEMKKIGKA